MFNDRLILQNKTGKSRNQKISKTLERSPIRDMPKDTRTVNTLTVGVVIFGIEITKMTATKTHRPRKIPRLQKRHLQARLK